MESYSIRLSDINEEKNYRFLSGFRERTKAHFSENEQNECLRKFMQSQRS